MGGTQQLTAGKDAPGLTHQRCHDLKLSGSQWDYPLLYLNLIMGSIQRNISDPNHFAYPTFAKAARQRADNLQVSIKELKVQEEALELALEEMQAEYARATALEERDGAVRVRA